MREKNSMRLIYNLSGSDLYGSISVENEKFSAPFIISKVLDGKEIVYGSMVDLVVKTSNVLAKYNDYQRQRTEYLDERGRKSPNSKPKLGSIEIPDFDGVDAFIHNQEEKLEETMLLLGIYLRLLTEIFGNGIDEELVIYDYEGQDSSRKIYMRELNNILMHNRYLVFRNQYLMNMFSDKRGLPSGSKINVLNYFSSARKIIEKNITFDSFLNMMKSKLNSISVQSKPQEIIFLTQNIHSLNKMVESKIFDSRFPKMQNFLFRNVINGVLKRAESQYTNSDVQTAMFTTSPLKFAIANDLSSKKIVVQSNIDGIDEKMEFGYEDIFSALGRSFGKDPLISFKKI